MMIYSQHFFRRRKRKLPVPSCMPLTIFFAIMCMIVIAVMSPVITGVNVDLPSLNTEAIEVYDDFKYITIYIDDKDNVAVNRVRTTAEDVGNTIKLLHQKVSVEDIKVFIRATKNANYNNILDIIDKLHSEGFLDITLVGRYIDKR